MKSLISYLISFLILVSLPYPAVPDDFGKEALLGIDFGSEWIKLAVISHGSKLEIVLNENSKRKSLSAILFPESGTNNLRHFGEAAIVRPHKTLLYLRELLGMSYSRNNMYGPHYYPSSTVADDRRGTCLIRRDENSYSPEILNAMLMMYAKARAEDYTGKNISKCVITVPPYFTSVQRLAIFSASRIAGVSQRPLYPWRSPDRPFKQVSMSFRCSMTVQQSPSSTAWRTSI